MCVPQANASNNGSDAVVSKMYNPATQSSSSTPSNTSNQTQKNPPMYTIDKNFPGMIEPGNIDIANRPIVHNPDGSISTVETMGVEYNGKQYDIPTISPDGKHLTGKQAFALFRETGQHLGVFSTQDAADQYAQKLHEQQDKMYVKSNSTNKNSDNSDSNKQ